MKFSVLDTRRAGPAKEAVPLVEHCLNFMPIHVLPLGSAYSLKHRGLSALTLEERDDGSDHGDNQDEGDGHCVDRVGHREQAAADRRP